MSGTLENWQGYLQMISGIGQIRTPLDMTDIHTLEGISVLTSRGRFGLSWVNACGESTGSSIRTI